MVLGIDTKWQSQVYFPSSLSLSSPQLPTQTAEASTPFFFKKFPRVEHRFKRQWWQYPSLTSEQNKNGEWQSFAPIHETSGQVEPLSSRPLAIHRWTGNSFPAKTFNFLLLLFPPKLFSSYHGHGQAGQPRKLEDRSRKVPAPLNLESLDLKGLRHRQPVHALPHHAVLGSGGSRNGFFPESPGRSSGLTGSLST